MTELIWLVKVFVIFLIICLLAYCAPGLCLRAINDFKRRYGKEEADGKTMEKGARDRKTQEKR